MRLYPKKLSSIEDLEQEQLLLKKQLKKLGNEDLFSVSTILGSGKSAEEKTKNKGAEEEGGNMSFLLDLLPMAYPLIETGIKKITQPKKEKREKSSDADEDTKPGKNIIKTVALELITGYLKWKAIELSYKGVKYIIKRKKEKKALAELEEQMG